MEGQRSAGWTLLCMVTLSAFPAPVRAAEPGGGNWLRWSADADWEYFHSDTDNGGFTSDIDSVRQKYSLGLSGVIWDPRFNTFNTGVDLYRLNTDQNGDSIDSTTLGYRASTTFFPSRPLSFSTYVRRVATDVSAAALASNDRETNAWGADWQFVGPRAGSLRARFDRTRYELQAPLLLQERRKLGQMDYDGSWGRNDLSFRYSRSREQERTQDTDYRRQDFSLVNRTQFENDSVLSVNSRRGFSDARFASGQEDELDSSSVSARYDLPLPRWRLGWNYDFNDVDGMFVDSTSNLLRTRAQVKVGAGWEMNGDLTLGRVETDSTTSGIIRQDLRGIRAGARYTKEWRRVVVGTAYAVGYDGAEARGDVDRRSVSQHFSTNLTYAVNADEIFGTLEYDRNNNDTSGVGFTADGTRIRAGWERRLEGGWRVRTVAYYRETVRDTFDFGLQESDEVGLESALSQSRGGVSLTLLTRKGISDFIPDPAVPAPFAVGSDLVNEADIGILDVHWRLVRGLRLRMQARLEDRQFSSIGEEKILYYNSEIDYAWHDWTFSLGVSHYERNNDTGVSDDTILVKVTRRFF